MNFRKYAFSICMFVICLSIHAQQSNNAIFKSDAFSIFPDHITQGRFEARILSSTAMTSNYKSPEADKYSPDIQFKFSINSRDNEMMPNMDHVVTIQPVDGKFITDVEFGKQLNALKQTDKHVNLPENTLWTVRLDMRKVLASFEKDGYYTLYNGEKLAKTDFKGVYIAGSSAPLSWDFVNLYNKQELELKDNNGDGIFETTLTMNSKSNQKTTDDKWMLTKNLSALPQYSSDFPVSDAIYNLSLEEMLRAIEPDSTFRTGKEWSGVWTRDISYSIILSMAHMQPQVAKYSLMHKVKNNRIIQDTGTGGAYPVSTDRMIWAVAAWELYKVTGDKNWLLYAFDVIRNSIEDDMKNAYNPVTGLVKGESSFLDWREQTYPLWMQPVDIYNSENLGTNAVHYQANIVLAQMAESLNDKANYTKYKTQAETIKTGINKYLWMGDKGYYGQFLYGRNNLILSPRAEALGEALSVLFGIADGERSKTIVSNTPVVDFGIPCIYPQIPGIPPYHNNAIWPFVQSYWALASAKAGNEQSVLQSIAAIYRPAALFLTNKENFVAESGDFAGTQINSSVMLWSLSGNLALVHKLLFGIDFQTDKLVFKPFVPKTLTGKRTLSNFRYRNAVLNIEMTGFGNKIKSFSMDGEECEAQISSSLQGTHHIKIELTSTDFEATSTANNEVIFTVQTPEVQLNGNILSWNKVENAERYTVIKNGIKLKETTGNSIKIKAKQFAEYQVIAIDTNKIQSFASEPVLTNCKKQQIVYQLEDLLVSSTLNYKNFNGKGFVEVSKQKNQKIEIQVTVKSKGLYSISFRYANGNGPINTENKCALRTLNVNGNFAGTLVLPQRGKNEWSNWGTSNFIHVNLEKGKNVIIVSFEPNNENMYGEINDALLDEMTIYKID